MLSREQIREICGNRRTPGNFGWQQGSMNPPRRPPIVQLTLPDGDPAKHTVLLLLLCSLCKAIRKDPRAYSTNKQDHVLHDNPRWKLTIILLLSGVGSTRWVQVTCMQKEIFYMYKCWGEGGGNNLKPGSRKVTKAICSFVISSQDVHRLKFTYSLFCFHFHRTSFKVEM